jgi:hypothetical protein
MSLECSYYICIQIGNKFVIMTSLCCSSNSALLDPLLAAVCGDAAGAAVIDLITPVQKRAIAFNITLIKGLGLLYAS